MTVHSISRAACALLLLCDPFLLHAQGTSGVVRGTVTELASGRRLAGVRIQSDGTEATAVSDATGTFDLSGVPAGSRTVSLRLEGFRELRQSVTVVAGRTTSLSVTLSNMRSTASRHTKLADLQSIDINIPETSLTRKPSDEAEFSGRQPPRQYGVAKTATTAGAGSAVRQTAPAEVLQRSPIAYPNELIGSGLSGDATVEVIVSASGELEQETFTAVQARHPAFAAALHDAISRMSFAAATVDGDRVRNRVRVTYSFVPPSPDPASAAQTSTPAEGAVEVVRIGPYPAGVGTYSGRLMRSGKAMRCEIGRASDCYAVSIGVVNASREAMVCRPKIVYDAGGSDLLADSSVVSAAAGSESLLLRPQRTVRLTDDLRWWVRCVPQVPRFAGATDLGGAIANVNEASSASMPYFDFKIDSSAALIAADPPIYPQALKAAGIEGQVVAQFIVDTTGRAEMGSFTVKNTTHLEFAESVRAVIVSARFRPAFVGARKVRQLVVQPFEFSLNRRAAVSDSVKRKP